ncbi:peptidoglycan D,D-transpeptidase FtsI family protein [Paracoccus litorisediminis]|uniref:peptidoglycan D,D-transpeptidase FtsI family protein n=1 Tax=Paracoccus litorisediminis TaxID=2006130 RepID=UPI00372E0676
MSRHLPLAKGAGFVSLPAGNYSERREKFRSKGALRLIVVSGFFATFYSAIGWRMSEIAGAKTEEPMAIAEAGPDYNQRAEIVDRHGRILAMNMPSQALYATPHILIDPEYAASELVKIFPDMKVETLLKDFRGGRKFLWLRKNISPEQMQAVHDIGEPGLLFARRDMRLYPNGQVAGHILGGVRYGREDVDQAEIVGVAGVEKAFDRWLSDPGNRGEQLRLSIDLTVQDTLETILADGVAKFHAKGAAAILMRADSGEVLAMASMPDFDPNIRPAPMVQGDPSDSPLFNRAVQGVYELGSTFKVFAAAQAMDLGLVGPETLVSAKGPMQVGRFRIRDMHNYGDMLTVTQIINKSSNVGTANLARMIGVERQRIFLEKLGLTRPTTIELGEAPTGRPIVPVKWPEITSYTVAYGHGLSTSPLHLAAAYSTILNGGHKISPSLMAGHTAEPGELVIKPLSSKRMRDMLRSTVTEGTAKAANIAGYAVGGKTGTAEKPKRNGKGYHKDKVIATFAGAFPMNDPEYVLVLSLDEAEDRSTSITWRTAGWTAVPVAGDVITRIGPILGLAPQQEPVNLKVAGEKGKHH